MKEFTTLDGTTVALQFNSVGAFSYSERMLSYLLNTLEKRQQSKWISRTQKSNLRRSRIWRNFYCKGIKARNKKTEVNMPLSRHKNNKKLYAEFMPSKGRTTADSKLLLWWLLATLWSFGCRASGSWSLTFRLALSPALWSIFLTVSGHQEVLIRFQMHQCSLSKLKS